MFRRVPYPSRNNLERDNAATKSVEGNTTSFHGKAWPWVSLSQWNEKDEDVRFEMLLLETEGYQSTGAVFIFGGNLSPWIQICHFYTKGSMFLVHRIHIPLSLGSESLREIKSIGEFLARAS